MKIILTEKTLKLLAIGGITMIYVNLDEEETDSKLKRESNFPTHGIPLNALPLSIYQKRKAYVHSQHSRIMSINVYSKYNEYKRLL
uniref:Uncharacterized protein n=1 Tax=Glossina brevipalpis TaxID=37001 RepID=A0A1A9WW08_9MUSC